MLPLISFMDYRKKTRTRLRDITFFLDAYNMIVGRNISHLNFLFLIISDHHIRIENCISLV